jgi:hypothetical protein
MSVSFDRKILNGNNTILDDPHDKCFATSAQVKKAAKRGKKTLKRFWANEINEQIEEKD